MDTPSAKKSSGTGPIRLELQDPIRDGDEEIRVLTLQQPRAKHLRQLPCRAEDYNGDVWLNIAGELAGLPNVLIDRLSTRDGTRLIEVVTGFFDGSPTTGARP